MDDGDQKKNQNDKMTALFLKDMKPRPASIELNKTALIIIDMQIDFLEPGGFGELLGNDVSKLQRAIVPTKNLLDAARKAGMFIIHTREGHRPCESDLHRRKRIRLGVDENESDKDNNDNNKNSNTHNIGVIGSPGPNGRILIRGEPGHDIIESLRPKTTTAGGAMIEPIIDKPGKGSFYGTDLECILRARGIETLLVCGVTTEVCVHTTVREANDRGYACIVISDACASYFDDFHKVALEMIVAQGGIFGSVTDSKTVIEALKTNK